MSLATTYRPTKWSDVVGQDIVSNLLKYQIDNNCVANVLCFVGSAGTGKTTSARIFAKEINKGIDNKIEIDAASNNSVDNIRKITDECRFQTIGGGYRVYILDEAHMLSIGAWNALLKLLEEPPKNVIFILCTTDPQKIPATILSRVQRYDFKRIPKDIIIQRLEYIISEENKKGKNLKVDADALSYIAKIVNGGMRDAITLLDKCVSYKPAITLKDVLDITNSVDYSEMLELLSNIKDKKTKETIQIIETINNNGKDLKLYVKNLCSFITEIYKYKLNDSMKDTDLPDNLENELKQKGESFYVFCRSILFLMNQLYIDIKNEQKPKTTIECMMIKLCEEIGR